MKRSLKLMLVLGFVALLSGCSTVDFSMPSGFSHGARKDLIRMKFAEPQSNVQLSASQKSALLELPKTTMISNKRFVVLAGSKGELTGMENYDFEIRPYADLTQVSSQRYHGYGCIIKLDVRLNDKTAGAYEDGFVIKDGFALEKTNNRIGSSGYTMDWNLVFSKAYFKALKQMNAKIREIYPICGTVINFKNKVEKMEFQIDRGTNYGIEKNDEFVVYYVDSDESITIVALAKGMIGRERSYLTVTHWNTQDSEVLHEIMPRIRRGDKKLLGNLFVVCRQPRKK